MNESLRKQLNDYYKSLLALGIKFVGEDILDVNVDKNDVRVAFRTYNEKEGYVKKIVKKFNDLTAKDYVNAYNFSILVDESNADIKDKAIRYIADIIKYRDDKIIINNRLVEEIKKAKNTGKFELVEVSEEVKKDSDLLKSARDFLKNNTAYIAGAIIVGGALVYAFANNHDDNKVNENTEIESTIEDEVIESNINEPLQDDTLSDTLSDDVIDENTDEIIEDTNDEEVLVSFDINNNDAINATVDKIYEDIQSINDDNFKAEMDKDTIEALVRYTRHSNSEYSGANYISNEYAYELLTEFYLRKYNIANFFENLDNFDKLNDLVTKSFNIKEEKDNYDDELEVYQSMDYCINTLDAQNYPEVIALRTIVDNTVDIDSMKLVASIGLENGLEGEEYITEKAKAFNVDAKETFNKVDINNENAPLTQATYKAIEEDETLGLSR